MAEKAGPEGYRPRTRETDARGGKLDPTFNITVPESIDAGG
jgi:hypothetical protein